MDPAVDLSLHPPAPPAKTLIVTNRLLQQTAEQLNAFATKCEDKLIMMHHKMLRLETGVKLLEAKLGSLPGAPLTTPANGSAASAAAPPPPPIAEGGAANPAAAAAAPPAPPPPPGGASPAAPSEPAPPEAPEEPINKIKDDPRFAKYFKMEKMGVPKPAIAMKFAQELDGGPAEYQC